MHASAKEFNHRDRFEGARDSQNRDLTSLSTGGGCGCKVDPSQLAQLLSSLPRIPNVPELTVGPEHNDDAAIYQINEHQSLIFTNDFQTPLVDDAFIYGYAAAANALSDVYAMGGMPVMATAIAGFPVEKLDNDRLSLVLEGGLEACRTAGTALAGGHTITNPQPIFGLSVVGIVHPTRVKTNGGAQPGDRLILTHPLGTGILSSAYRANVLDDAGYSELVGAITHLNTAGTWLGSQTSVHALTDITGFGLVGHLVEMAEAAGMRFDIDLDAVRVLPSAYPLSREGFFPGAAYRNIQSYSDRMNFDGEDDIDRQLIYTDPQTNGGLLVAVDETKADEILDRVRELGCGQAAIIGEVSAEPDDRMYVHLN
jgi:selenide,water dikinase